MSKVLHRIRTVCLLRQVLTVPPMYMPSRLRLRRLRSSTKLLLLASALLSPVAIAGDGRYVERWIGLFGNRVDCPFLRIYISPSWAFTLWRIAILRLLPLTHYACDFCIDSMLWIREFARRPLQQLHSFQPGVHVYACFLPSASLCSRTCRLSSLKKRAKPRTSYARGHALWCSWSTPTCATTASRS